LAIRWRDVGAAPDGPVDAGRALDEPEARTMRWGTIQPQRGGQSLRAMPIAPTDEAMWESGPGPELIVEPERIGHRTGRLMSTRWLAAGFGVLALFVVAATPSSPATQADAPGSEQSVAAAPTPSGRPPSPRFEAMITTRPASVSLEFPEEGAFIAGPTIAVAGRTLSRPHASSAHVRAVEIELITGSSLVGRSVLPVYSGRFAGTIAVVGARRTAPATVRVRVADLPTRTWIERPVTLRNAADRPSPSSGQAWLSACRI
jgi:hypothetical protein